MCFMHPKPPGLCVPANVLFVSSTHHNTRGFQEDSDLLVVQGTSLPLERRCFGESLSAMAGVVAMDHLPR